LEVNSRFAEAMQDIVAGEEIILITWFHEAERNILKVHPRNDVSVPLTGVFSTRSPDRPNPLGLHRVTVREIVGNQIRIGPIEAIDGTPVVDIKPVLRRSPES
jgi:tRNA-Thr(GGU) m(6)t(6)A37 methyltransferase TsaA